MNKPEVKGQRTEDRKFLTAYVAINQPWVIQNMMPTHF